MDVDKLTKQILREAKFRKIQENILKLEQQHIEMTYSDKCNETDKVARLQKRAWKTIQKLKKQVFHD